MSKQRRIVWYVKCVASKKEFCVLHFCHENMNVYRAQSPFSEKYLENQRLSKLQCILKTNAEQRRTQSVFIF